MIIAMMIFAAAQAALVSAKPPSNCKFDEAAKQSNAKLSFDEFDQSFSAPTGWRTLETAGCHNEAVDALSDYMVRGPLATPSHQRILLFHIGQLFALNGQEARAAQFIAATRDPEIDLRGNSLNWNDYVIGTWAFLTKDRELLIRSRQAVVAAGGKNNLTNAGFLGGLERCFDRPYRMAYNPNCGK